jgi:peptide/nickel transport system substrate-binding protein
MHIMHRFEQKLKIRQYREVFRRTISILVILLVATSLLPGLQPNVLRQAKAQQETTLRLGITSFPDSFNPLTYITTESGNLLSMIYDMGIQMEGLKGEPVPDLAESWLVSPDGLTWTFHFVKNATWHDGIPFTSEDFKFTLDYCTDYPDFNETLQQAMVISYMSTVIKTDTPDAYTAIVHLSAPLADFGQPFFWILPKHIWENVPKEEAAKTYKNTPPIGTGPFKYVDSKINEYVKLDANKQYFGGAPKIDHILLKYYADPDTMVQALVTGEVDAITPPSGSVAKLATENNIKVVMWPSRSISELGFNTWDDPASKGSPALKDYKFRQALAHAVNKTEIIKLAYLGLAEPAESVLTPKMTLYYWNPSEAEKLAFDLDKANAMLDELGYTKWDESHTYRIDPTTDGPFMLNMYVTNDATELISAGTLIINWFKEIGIGLQLRVVDSAQMIDTNLAGAMDMYLWGWSFDADPDFALSVFTTRQIGSWSDCFYSNVNYDNLYDKQHTAVDLQDRKNTITEMQKLLYSDAPYVVLAYSYTIRAYRTDSFTGWVDPTQNPGWDIYWWKFPGQLEPISAPTTPPPAAAPGIELYIAALVVVVLAIAAVVVLRKHRATAREEKET